jgi:hypothetical protein
MEAESMNQINVSQRFLRLFIAAVVWGFWTGSALMIFGRQIF